MQNQTFCYQICVSPMINFRACVVKRAEGENLKCESCQAYVDMITFDLFNFLPPPPKAEPRAKHMNPPVTYSFA